MYSGFNPKGEISVAKQGELQKGSPTGEGPLQKKWWGPPVLRATAASCSLHSHCLQQEIAMHPTGKTGTPAVKADCNVCITQWCWAYTEPSKRQREEEAMSLFLCEALQRMSAEFFVLFFKEW